MLEYKNRPFELKAVPGRKSEKVYLENCKDAATVVTSEEAWQQGDTIVLCKDSAHTSIPDESVDLVVTDPPFFDNVNYSELADFFYVWLKKFDIGVGDETSDTTRVAGEVQDNQPEKFSNKLCDVFKECHRVLKPEGLLIFTYHHSRAEGWVSVYDAITDAGFSISQVVPLKAEMAVSVAIMAAKEPINYDLVFVCRKMSEYEQIKLSLGNEMYYREGLKRIENSGLKVSRGDKMIFKYGLSLKQLSDSGMQTITKDHIEAIVQSLEADS